MLCAEWKRPLAKRQKAKKILEISESESVLTADVSFFNAISDTWNPISRDVKALRWSVI